MMLCESLIISNNNYLIIKLGSKEKGFAQLPSNSRQKEVKCMRHAIFLSIWKHNHFAQET